MSLHQNSYTRYQNDFFSHPHTPFIVDQISSKSHQSNHTHINKNRVSHIIVNHIVVLPVAFFDKASKNWTESESRAEAEPSQKVKKIWFRSSTSCGPPRKTLTSSSTMGKPFCLWLEIVLFWRNNNKQKWNCRFETANWKIFWDMPKFLCKNLLEPFFWEVKNISGHA